MTIVQSDVVQKLTAGKEDYPFNLNLDIQQHAAEAIREQLDFHAPKLFCFAGQADVHVHEICRSDEGFESIRLHDEANLERRLFASREESKPDPRCSFIGAKTSRSRLHVTRDMFLQLLTYHRVMPAFLEYVFPFGVKLDRRDAFGGTFRTEPCLSGDEKGYHDHRRGRSGRHIEFCYCLQSVERVKVPRSSWSIRMCAVWNTIDLEKERQAWIIVKANGLIENAIRSHTARKPYDEPGNTNDLSRAMKLSLSTHLEIAKWSVQNWHWYLSSLEEELQTTTSPALMPNVNAPRLAPLRTTSTLSPSRATTLVDDEKARRTRTRSSTTKSFFSWRQPLQRVVTNLTELNDDSSSSDEDSIIETTTVEPEFSFRNLQDLERLEEKANDVSMITTSNLKVLQQIRQEYLAVFDNLDGFPSALRDCLPDFRLFERRLKGFETEYELFHARVKAFSHLLQERKALLYGILQHSNMKASLLVSEKAQDSARKMEIITEEMHKVAQKTQTETVSMRIITVVTLLFLPGTFISTLMSTPIVTFSNGGPNLSDTKVSVGALQLFCVVSIPLMFCTVASWYAMHKRAQRQQQIMSKLFHDNM